MEIRVGKVTHYYNHLCVAVLELSDDLKVGDAIHILGRVTDFEQRVGSLEIEHHKLQAVKAGEEVALHVIEVARKGDTVFKVIEEQGVEAASPPGNS